MYRFLFSTSYRASYIQQSVYLFPINIPLKQVSSSNLNESILILIHKCSPHPTPPYLHTYMHTHINMHMHRHKHVVLIQVHQISFRATGSPISRSLTFQAFTQVFLSVYNNLPFPQSGSLPAILQIPSQLFPPGSLLIAPVFLRILHPYSHSTLYIYTILFHYLVITFLYSH